MGTITTAGTIVSISATLPATNNAAGFAAVTGLEPVGFTTDIGAFGSTYTPVSSIYIGDRIEREAKGSKKLGNPSIVVDTDYDDAGQNLLREAAESDANYTIKYLYTDGVVQWFQAKVMSNEKSNGDANKYVNQTFNLAIQEEIIYVAAP